MFTSKNKNMKVLRKLDKSNRIRLIKKKDLLWTNWLYEKHKQKQGFTRKD